MDDPLIYISSNALQKRDALELLEERRQHLDWGPGERVLDIGCGPGDVTSSVLFPLLPQDSTLVGCDISQEMIEYCNQFIKNDRMSFKIQDIQGKEISSSLQLESFDKIFSFYCLHWIKDQRQAMKNIFSLLKPGGEILLMFITPDNPVLVMLEKLKDSDKWNKFMKDREQYFYSSEDPTSFFNSILQDVGFDNINCYLRKRVHHFPSWQYIEGLLKAVNPYLRYIPEERRSEFTEELMDILKEKRYLKYDAAKEQPTHEYNLLVVAGRKPNTTSSFQQF